MRGEHIPCLPICTAMPGSSPHARGAQGLTRPRVQVCGIIPAYAGSTCRPCRPASTRWDHPRMRGEHSASSTTYLPPAGLSPHARGAHIAFVAPAPVAGIIPACAGSTRPPRGATRRSWDHPRMRGEHVLPSALNPRLTESSPHRREARRRLRRSVPTTGIIPACAGSTRRSRTGRSARGDHPRMRGEHSVDGTGFSMPAGSSPHARGARRPVGGARRRWGIIPACAGSTVTSKRTGTPSRNHPRMRGEH